MLIASVDSNDCAAGNFRSMATLDDAMEEEVRQILHQVMKPAEPAATSEGLGLAFTTTSPCSEAPNWSCHHGATRLQRLIS